MGTPEGMGIKAILQEYGELTGSQFLAIQQALLDAIPRPKVEYEGPTLVNYGDKLRFKIKGLPLPKIDLYEYAFKDSEADDMPVLVSFYSKNGPITVEAKYDPETGDAEVSVPKPATDGAVTVSFCVRGYIGPLELVKELNAEDETLWGGIFTWVPSGDEFPEFCPECAPVEGIDRTWYLPIDAGRFEFGCHLLLDCPIRCPTGALQKDENGRCFVDVELCEGQNCRQCFMGTETYSLKCLQGRLKQVLWVDADLCCARCTMTWRRVDRLTLQQLCPYEAIYIESPASGHDYFAVDEARCIGCMACYNGIDCRRQAIRMVAHVERP